MNLFDLKTYTYDLPSELIAQRPLEPRDCSRLLVLDRKSGKIEHRIFKDIVEFFGAQDVFVANNTKVIPARFRGHRVLEQTSKGSSGGGAVEFLLLEKKSQENSSEHVWEGICRSAAKQKKGLLMEFPTPSGQPLIAELISGSIDSVSGTVIARFDRDPVTSGAGEIPLPPYIEERRQGHSDQKDVQDYQTVYAGQLGSAAAPTAGLHFTDTLLSHLKQKGVSWQELTLHVGLGTFRPVKAQDIRQHVMHEERYEISERVANLLSESRAQGKKITAVGTTSLRTLESAYDPVAKKFKSGTSRTSIFLYPGGHKIQSVDHLLTNFHLPESTLLMLVCSFADTDLILRAYREAVRERYRFFSYGDAMLIL